MFFLKQLQDQFFMTVCAYEVAPEWPSGGSDAEETQTTNPETALSPEKQRQLATIDGIKEELANLRAAEQVVGQDMTRLGREVYKITAGEYPDADPTDEEFIELRERYDLKLREYEGLTAEQWDLDAIIRFRLAEFTQAVDETREEIVSGELQEDVDFRHTQEGREALLHAMQELPENATDEQLQALAREFGTRNVHLMIHSLEDDATVEWANTETINSNIAQLTRLMAAVDNRTFENMEALGTMSDEEFISNIPQGERLQYFVRGEVDFASLEAGQNLEMTFTYEWVHNHALETLTAGQIFPESVSVIVVDGIEYHRRGLLGEFYTQVGEWQNARRLFIRESESLQIGTVREEDAIQTERERIEAAVAGSPEAERDLQRAAEERGLGRLDSGTIRVLQDLVPWIGEAGRSSAVESNITNLAERVWPETALDLEWLRSEWLIWWLLAWILEAMQSMDGEQNAGRSSVNEAASSYAGGIGISPEDVARYGNTGAQLAQWLQSSGFPVYNGQPFYCGQNVGMALNAFGIEWLPNSGRHGYRWAEICRSRPDQFQRVNCTPQEAPAGAIISYNRGTGWSEARQWYGHVEIALGQNRGYYFGQVANNPGGSNPNFAAGTYEIYIPTSMA